MKQPSMKPIDSLYLLCFDHRHSYTSGLFNFSLPLSAEQSAEVRASKELVYAGFKRALRDGVAKKFAGLLVDEDFGADVLRDAKRRGFLTALSVERSGSDEFEFEHGADFAHRIDTIDPTFAKVVVRYNPEGDPALDKRESSRLHALSNHCRQSGRRLMVELLVPATDEQMARVDGDAVTYARELRPGLLQRAIRILQDAGVEPEVWAVEPPTLHGDCERIAEAARHDGREAVRCIVLADVASDEQMRAWLGVAAEVDGFVGFAVGRTVFWDAVAGHRAGTLSRTAAVALIATRLREWVQTFEQGRLSG
jgi:myo-inositol catabolism protein IolC